MFVDPYVNLGEHDLTAHVDFSALRHSLSGIDKCKVIEKKNCFEEKKSFFQEQNFYFRIFSTGTRTF